MSMHQNQAIKQVDDFRGVQTMITDLAVPYVDLHLAPYSLVADDATTAVAAANTAAVKQALTEVISTRTA
jgi:hypothetical protein